MEIFFYFRLTRNSGFEQANKYVIMDPNGNHVGFIAEEESGIAKIVARQWFRTHRAFTTHVFDKDEREVLRVIFPLSFNAYDLLHD